MIERIRIQNFKALRDVTLRLTKLHVLIGGNDSGKSSILQAIEGVCRTVDHDFATAFTGKWSGRDLVWMKDPECHPVFDLELEDQGQRFEYQLALDFADQRRQGFWREENIVMADEKLTPHPLDNHASSGIFYICHDGNKQPTEEANLRSKAVNATLKGVQYCRWDPTFLSYPVALDSTRGFRLDTSGFGLALVLDNILGYDRHLFEKIENRFCEIFDQFRSIRLIPEMALHSKFDQGQANPTFTGADGKGLYFVLEGSGEQMSAAQVSDGTMLVLAYLTMLYNPQPPRVLLVEEPENGIHPKRLGEVTRILRQLIETQQHTQVVMTTHSPYALDCFQPEEVTLCRREPDGSISVHPLSDSKPVRDQIDLFSLGEIWTAVGDDKLAEAAQPDQAAQA